MDRVDTSGTASAAVLLAIVALGATAGVAVRSEPEDVSPPRVFHRDPPGPAQIELAEAGLPVSPPATAPDPAGLFGVDVASSISVACGGPGSPAPFTPESVVCELAAHAVKHIPNVQSELVTLLLPSG